MANMYRPPTMSQDDRNRTPPGVPAGGQFAAEDKDEPTAHLGGLSPDSEKTASIGDDLASSPWAISDHDLDRSVDAKYGITDISDAEARAIAGRFDSEKYPNLHILGLHGVVDREGLSADVDQAINDPQASAVSRKRLAVLSIWNLNR